MKKAVLTIKVELDYADEYDYAELVVRVMDSIRENGSADIITVEKPT